MKPTFYLNASALNVKSLCRLRLRYTIADGYNVDIGRYNDVFFGTCWHLFRQHLAASKGDTTKAMTEALNHWSKNNSKVIYKPKKQYIDASFLSRAILSFTNRYSDWNNVEGFNYYMDDRGIPLTESKIIFPFYSCEAFDLVLVGTIDALGWIGDTFTILDDKTTSSWDKEEYMDKYTVSPQMMYYTWLIRQIVAHNPDSVLGKLFSEHKAFGCSIFGVFHTAKGVEFMRSPIIRFSEDRLRDFQCSLTKVLHEVVNILELYTYSKTHEGFYAMKDGYVNGSCKLFGQQDCPYIASCNFPTMQESLIYLDAVIGQKPYNPLETHDDL